MSIFLEDDRIRLRAIEPEDLSDLYRWENDELFWQDGNTLIPYSKFLLKQYIEQQSDDIFVSKQLRLMIEEKESFANIGTIDLFDFDAKNMRAGVGILVDREFQKKGFAFSAVSLLLNYAFETLNLNQVYCTIREKNNASINLFEKCGFEVCGLLKNWLRVGNTWQNCYIYQKLK